MPVYEYQCSACDTRFSQFFRSANAVAVSVTCTRCGRPDAQRLISNFQYHQSLKTQIEQIDPTFEKQMDWADRHHKATDPLNRVNLDFDRAQD
ncbi:MAG: FmdB family zinc ribbon protein [Dehalococcoidia bacterium]